MTSSLETSVVDRAVSAGVLDIEELIASLPAEHAAPAAGGNGGPDLTPSYAAIAAIVSPVLGDRWEGKIAGKISQTERQVYRWRDGEGRGPDEKAMLNVEEWALKTAHHLLASIGEADIAHDVGIILARRKAASKVRGAPGWDATVARFEARSPEDVERSRLALEALDAKAEARRAAKAARLAETASRGLCRSAYRPQI